MDVFWTFPKEKLCKWTIKKLLYLTKKVFSIVMSYFLIFNYFLINKQMSEVKKTRIE